MLADGLTKNDRALTENLRKFVRNNKWSVCSLPRKDIKELEAEGQSVEDIFVLHWWGEILKLKKDECVRD